MRNVVLLCLTSILLSQQAHAEEIQPLTSQKAKVSYAIGVDLAKNFKKQAIDVDLDSVINGMRSETAGAKLLMNDTEMRKILTDYNLELKTKQAQIRKQTAENNKKDGIAFLEGNKTREGVVTTASGLQYKILKVGNGPKPNDDDGVTCRYRGTLLDGTEFDNSDSSGFTYPVTFYVKDSVIEGWKEALKLMPAGSKWQIFIPSERGFGEKGVGQSVGPNATLIYEIELLAVNPQPVTPQKKD